MKRSSWLLCAAALSVLVCVWVITASRIAAYEADVVAARQARNETARVARQITEYGNTAASDADVMPAVQQALNTCRLPTTSLVSLRNRGSGKSRRVELRLAGLKAHELAQWYQEFHSHTRGWKAEEVTLTPRSAPATSTSPTPSGLDAMIILALSR